MEDYRYKFQLPDGSYLTTFIKTANKVTIGARLLVNNITYKVNCVSLVKGNLWKLNVEEINLVEATYIQIKTDYIEKALFKLERFIRKIRRLIRKWRNFRIISRTP